MSKTKEVRVTQEDYHFIRQMAKNRKLTNSKFMSLMVNDWKIYKKHQQLKLINKGF